MKKLLFLIAFAFALSSAATAANAQASASSETSVSASAPAPLTENPPKLRAEVNVNTGIRKPAPLYNDKKDLQYIREHAQEEAKRLASTTRAALSEKREEIKDEIKDRASTTRADLMEKRDEFRQNASTTRGEIRAEVKDRVVANLKDKIAKTSAQLVAMVARLSTIADKVDSRLMKIKDAGTDVSAAISAMTNVRTKIAAADASAKAVANVTVSSEDPRSSLEALKSAVETARVALRSAHDALVDVVNSLKASANVSGSINSNQ